MWREPESDHAIYEKCCPFRPGPDGAVPYEGPKYPSAYSRVYIGTTTWYCELPGGILPAGPADYPGHWKAPAGIHTGHTQHRGRIITAPIFAGNDNTYGGRCNSGNGLDHSGTSNFFSPKQVDSQEPGTEYPGDVREHIPHGDDHAPDEYALCRKEADHD